VLPTSTTDMHLSGSCDTAYAAAQNARKKALENVEEDIQDNAINGSISERHLINGNKVHEVAKEVREKFFEHQDKLYLKRLIKPEHRFLD